jgi:hypothetical protein
MMKQMRKVMRQPMKRGVISLLLDFSDDF